MGSGGGGSSGKSDWPDYMKNKHTVWLEGIDALFPSTNPYTGAVAYDPSAILSALESSLSTFKAYLTSVATDLTSFKATWSGWVTTVTDDLTTALVAELETHGMPEFEGGMRNINAVQTSSFVLGKAMMYARVGLEAAKLALLNANQAMDSTMKFSEVLRGQFATEVDYSKVLIIAYKEEADRQIELDVEETKWPFFEYREAGAMLGAIGSSAAMQSSAKPNPAASALGGAMAGAAAGASFGPWGAAAGAVIGGIGGYLSAS